MGSAPKAPNPYEQGAAQGRAETSAALGSSIINNPNIYTPYGSQTWQLAGWEQVPDAKGKMMWTPRYNQVQTLSPDQMKLLGLETQAKGNAGQAAVSGSAKLAEMMKTGVDPSKWQAWQMAAKPGEVRQDQSPTDRAATEAAMMSRYRENAAKSSAAEDAQLAARGLNPGSSMYGSVADTRARAATDAGNQAYLASGEESRRNQAAFNQAALQKYQTNADWAAFANNLRGQQSQEAFALRSQPINEIAALLGMGQVSLPQFQPMSRQGINAAPIGQYMQDSYTNQLNAYNAQNQGLFGLGGSILGIPGLFG